MYSWTHIGLSAVVVSTISTGPRAFLVVCEKTSAALKGGIEIRD